MEFTRPFSKLAKNNADIAGGKGASLGEMTQAGIPVPPGFVILAPAFEQFLKETDLTQEIEAILGRVNHHEIHTVEAAAEQIKSLILSREMPTDIAAVVEQSFTQLGSRFVAVRSSATAEDGVDHAWAGQLESYLNTTESTLLDTIKCCWASLFTPRAIFYRFEKGLHATKISVAVVVQKMVESEASGIAFSVHPITEDYNQLIIEAGYGLGEAIVSGAVTPDAYVVEKQSRRIIDINVAKKTRGLYRAVTTQSGATVAEHDNNEWRMITEPQASRQVLTDTQILELSEIIIQIENHYGFPCDIEWAFASGMFYIVQSRPITTLGKKTVDVLVAVKTFSPHSKYNPANYIRMFAGKSFPYLFSNVFLQYYRALGVVSIQGEGSWMSFFPKERVAETQSKGKILYSSMSEYKTYKAAFDAYIDSSREYFDALEKKAEKEVITDIDVRTFFEQVSNLFVYYSKTEFFYTDGVDQTTMAITVKEFDDLKLGGRAYLNTLFFEQNGRIKSFIRKIAQQTGVLEEELLNYNALELADLVAHGKKILPDLVAERNTFFESADEILFGDAAQTVIDKFFTEYMQISDTIRGTIANKGKVRGKARVLVPDAKDFDKIAEAVKEMKAGEILVAETTSPDIIAACKKAAAIITNQGGQLSHAAIVSRELGIPCIIGTDKDVILNIKTGDDLDVDADYGIIRILK